MTGAANRRRGADAERAIVRWLNTNGHNARRYLAGDGKQPGDIDWHPLVVLEVKDVASSAWPSWCRQADKAAGPDQVPVVVRRTRGVPDPGQWECRFPYGAVPAFRLELVASHGGTVDDEVWLSAPFAVFVAALNRVGAL